MTVLPERYQPALGLYETQKAIGLIKNIFQVKLCAALHLKRVTAPLFVDPATGLNDDLNGVERPVGFDIPAVGIEGQVVHSLAKWKRLALHDYNFFVGNGLVADMNAIRRDEELDNLHSIYVDQWDWEKVIDESTRNEAYLKDTVRRIVSAICGTLDELKWQFSSLDTDLCRDVFFITAQELEDMYPQLTPKEREGIITKKHKTVFIQPIGGKLKSGKPHDGRAPDYDDWSLNGDLLFWHEPLQCALEISSMGIRVDPESLDKQLSLAGCDNRRELPFHKMLLNGELPLTIGGGGRFGEDIHCRVRGKREVHPGAENLPHHRGAVLPFRRGRLHCGPLRALGQQKAAPGRAGPPVPSDASPAPLHHGGRGPGLFPRGDGASGYRPVAGDSPHRPGKAHPPALGQAKPGPGKVYLPPSLCHAPSHVPLGPELRHRGGRDKSAGVAVCKQDHCAAQW